MPHKIWGLAIKIINEAADRVLATTNWALILTWCVLAAQQDTNGNSLLGLPGDAVMEGDDDYFVKWINQRLNATFGPCPTTGLLGPAGRGGTGQVNNPTQVSAIMANKVGKGVALGLWAIGHLQRDPIQAGGGYKTKTKGYTKDNIAAIMGFAGVYDGKNLPDIWDIFNATKGKNIEAYCHHIYARMKQYAYDWRIQINSSTYLEQETIKAIVELQFNPGKGVAHLASASKGLSILACQAHTTQETERVPEQEQALTATKKTRQLEDLLQFSKGNIRAPADIFGS
jgi:hypothetical protein